MVPTDHPDAILLTNKEGRSTQNKWLNNILREEKPFRVLHEIMHLLGFPDYYHEGLVVSGIRERTLQPGFFVLAKQHIMNGPPADPIIPLKDIKNLVAKGLTIQRDREAVMNWKQGLISDEVARRGMQLLEREGPKSAAAFANKVKKQYPENPFVRDFVGTVDVLLGRKKDFQEGMSKLPPFLRDASSRSVASNLMQLGSLRDAETVYWQYHDRNNADDHWRYVTLLRYHKTLHEEESIIWSKEHLLPRLDPHRELDRGALRNEAHYLVSKGYPHIALAYYEKMVSADPFDIDLLMSYAFALFASGQREKGILTLGKLVDAYELPVALGIAPMERAKFEKWIAETAEEQGLEHVVYGAILERPPNVSPKAAGIFLYLLTRWMPDELWAVD